MPNCPNDLSSQRDRFCAEHVERNAICAVHECERPIVEGQRVCDDSVHQSIERLYNLRGKSFFNLINRLERSRAAAQASAGGGGTSVEVGLHAETIAEEDFQVDDQGNIVVRAFARKCSPADTSLSLVDSSPTRPHFTTGRAGRAGRVFRGVRGPDSYPTSNSCSVRSHADA